MSQEWGDTLRQYRVRHGLSQQRLANVMSVSQRTVSRWERGEDKPSRDAQQRLRDLGLEPPCPLLLNLKAAIEHCPAPRALCEMPSLRLLTLSPPATKKRPSMANRIGEDLNTLATGVLAEMLDDRELQRAIANKEIACVIATTRSVLNTAESTAVGAFRTTISYFAHDDTIYSDAISVPASPEDDCGYRAIPVASL